MSFHPVRRGNIRVADQWQNGPTTVSKNRRWYRVPDHYKGFPVSAYPELNFRRRTSPR